MNKYYLFFKKGFFFVIGFLLIIFILQTIIFLLIKQITVGDYGVMNKINKGEINAEILISGTSRAYKGINPLIIENLTKKKCFNISTDGVDLGVQLPKIKWYLNKNKKPKILIQDISQFGGGISNEIYEPYKYLPYLSDDSLYFGLLKIKPSIWQNKYFFPVNLTLFNFDFYVKLFQELSYTFRGKENLQNGHLSDNSKWASSLEVLKRKFPNGLGVNISEKYSSYLLELVSLCKKENIKLLLVVLPNYFQIQEIAQDNNEVEKFYNSLKNQDEVYYLNFSKIKESKDTQYFYNFSHLNGNGANMFSSILADSIIHLFMEN